MRLHFCKIDLFFVEKYTRECCLWVCIAVKPFFCLTSYNFFDFIHRDNKIQKSICKVTRDKMCIYSFNISPQTIVQLCFSKQGFTRLKQIEVQLTAALHLPLDVVRRRKSLNLRIINHDFFWHSRRANRCEHNHTFYFHSLEAVCLYEIFRMGCFII